MQSEPVRLGSIRFASVPRSLLIEAMAYVPGLRSGYDKVGRLIHFGRMLDKIRLHAAGKLPADFHSNLGNGFDKRCCSFLRVNHPQLVTRTLEGGTDEQILEWCYAQGGPR